MNTKLVKTKKTEADAAVVNEASVQSITPNAKPAKIRTPEQMADTSGVGAAKEKSAKKKRNETPKVIRDSFSFPKSDYRKISELKAKCLGMGMPAKKSEILRAGLLLLETLSDEELKQAIGKVENLKTGRPLNPAK